MTVHWPAQLTDPAYAALVVGAVADGRFEHHYAPLAVEANGHRGVFRVSQDALKVGGVRVCVSAALQQRVADLLGACLLTPRLLDQMWRDRQVSLWPCVQPVTSSVAGMLRHSACVDRELAALGGAPPDGIVQTVGKTWVLDNRLSPTVAVNMGWHVVRPIPGAPFDPAPTLPGDHMVQAPGTHHGPDYVDYSQVCLLVDSECVVDDAYATFAEVAQSPELAPLVSAEGVLRFLRQPGVPREESVSPPLAMPRVRPGATVALTALGAGVGGMLAGPPGALAGAGIGWAAGAVRRRLRRP